MGHQKKSYKKFVATAATATLVASAIVPVASASFTDVAETNEFATYINTAVEAGYVKGYADGTFGLNDNLKRSQVVIIIGRYLESLGYTSESTTSPWSDVTDAEVIKYGNIVKDAEVFTGYADGTLNGAGLITRENMAVVLDRLAKTVTGTSLSEVAAEIEDVKVADLATANANYQESIQALRDLGISTADNFNPKGNVKRGQFAKFIVTAVENINAIEVTPEVTVEDIAKEIATVDATLPAVAYIKADNAVAAKTAVEAAKTAIAVIEAKIAEVEFTAEEVAGLEKAITAVEAKYEAIVKAADKAIEDAKQLAVESVKVLNATQVEVKFSKAVKESTIVNEGKLVANTVVIKSLDEKAVDLADATAELSKDGKTLVITVAEDEVFEGRYDITIEKITDADDKVMTKYEVKNVDFGKDTVAPTISNVEKVNASTVKVTFSEPLSAVGNFTFKDAEGKAVKVTASDLDANKVSVTLTIDGEVKAGTQIIATVIGAKDKAGNLLSPNPATFSFAKGDKDGVAPTVANAVAEGLNKFELTFSEEVQDLAVTDIEVDGTALTADNATLVQDKDNKTKYAVTLTDALAEGVHTISLAKAAATDLTGEELAEFSKVVEFKADKVAPKFVSSEVVTEVVNNQPVEKLVLTFDKEVVDPDALTVDSAKQVNADLVTTTGKLTADFALNAKNEKQVYVYLKDVKFAEADLAKGATYTFTAAKGSVEDASSNEAAAFTVSFKRTEDGVQTTTAPKVEDVKATNANELTVEFDKVVDGATATNVANYSIPGLVVEDATLNPAEEGKQTVTLKIKDGSNTLDGDRQITIKNVKAKDGEVMEEQTLTVADMLENVAPVVASAKFSKTEDGKVTEITLTFSEAVTVEENAFELFVGNATTATASTTAAVETKATTAVIKVTDGLTTEDIAKAITVKLADNKEVLDANNNVLKAFSVKAGY